MIDLTRVPPVVDDGIDPRLSALLRRAPRGVHVVFAGPDAPFLDALRRIYALPLPCPDVLICTRAKNILISVAARADADGLLLHLTAAPDEMFFVQPAIVFTSNRVDGARQRVLRQNDDHANLLIAALEDLLFRRVMPAECVS